MSIEQILHTLLLPDHYRGTPDDERSICSPKVTQDAVPGIVSVGRNLRTRQVMVVQVLVTQVEQAVKHAKVMVRHILVTLSVSPEHGKMETGNTQPNGNGWALQKVEELEAS